MISSYNFKSIVVFILILYIVGTIQILSSYLIFPKITLPTRISETCSTLIDNILANVIESNYDKAVILTSQISDHQTIFLSTNSKLSRDSGSKYINVETKDDSSLNNFINELENLNIPAQLNSELNANPNNNYRIFLAKP